MVVDTPGTRVPVALVGDEMRGGFPHWYAPYGLRVRSDFPLPLASAPDLAQDPPDVVIGRGAPGKCPAPDGPLVACAPCPTHGVDTLVHRGPGGAWIWCRALATFHVAADNRRVDVYLEAADVDEGALGLALVGPVALYILHRLGRPSLHASAVVTDHGAAAFFGPRGAGKSTVAAGFLRRGATLLTDDALPLRLHGGEVVGEPGLPFMKVWHETATSALGHAGDLPDLMADYEKKLLALDGRYAFAQGAVPLRALYVLGRYDPDIAGRADVELRRLSRQEALVALLLQTSNRSYLLPKEEAAFLPLYGRLVAQAPVYALNYPSGFEHQDAIEARVLANLREAR